MSTGVVLDEALEQARQRKASLVRSRDKRVCSMWNGSSTMVEIASAMSLSVKTVSAILRRAGLTTGPKP